MSQINLDYARVKRREDLYCVSRLICIISKNGDFNVFEARGELPGSTRMLLHSSSQLPFADHLIRQCLLHVVLKNSSHFTWPLTAARDFETLNLSMKYFANRINTHSPLMMNALLLDCMAKFSPYSDVLLCSRIFCLASLLAWACADLARAESMVSGPTPCKARKL